MMAPNTERIKKRYNRVAVVFDLLEKPMEKFTSSWRREIIKEVYGKVLEVGVGTGKNIPYYAPDVEVVAIDFSKKMLEKARAKYQHIFPDVTFIEMDVQQLDFSDNSFDCVVTSCVFCSVPLPVLGLKEIRRVLKPGGKLVMLEHVRSQKKLVGPLMDILNPIPLFLYGANINRRTVANLRQAGFKQITETNLWADTFKKIVAINGK